MPRSNMPSSENINKSPRSFAERSHNSLSDSPRLGSPDSPRYAAKRKRPPQARKTVNWRVVSGLTILLLVIPYIVISLAFSQSSGTLGSAVANSLNNAFGFASWMVPILLGAVSAALLEPAKGQKYSLHWFLPLVLASSLLMASKLGHRGGVWGTVIDNAVTHFVGDAGAWIAVLGSMVFAFIIFWQLSAAQVQEGLKDFSIWVQAAAVKAGQVALKWLKILGKCLFVFAVWAGTQIVKLWRASLAKGREKWEERQQARAYRNEEDFEYIDDYYDDADEAVDEPERAPFSFDDFNNEATARYDANNNMQGEPVYSERYRNADRENPLNPFEYGSHREPAPASNNASNNLEYDLEGTSVFTGDMLGRIRQEEFVSEIVAADAGLSRNSAGANGFAQNAATPASYNAAGSNSAGSAQTDNTLYEERNNEIAERNDAKERNDAIAERNNAIASALLEEPSGISVKAPGTLNFNDIFTASDKEGVKPVSRPIGRRSGSTAVPLRKIRSASGESVNAPAASQAAVRANAKNSGETAASAGANRAPRQKMSYQEAMYALTGRRPKTSESQKDKSASGESVSASAAAPSTASQKSDTPAVSPHMASQNADAPAANQAAVRANAKSSGETAASAGANRAPRQKMSYQEAMYALTGRRPKTAESQKDKSASGESASASAAAPSAVSQNSDAPAVSPHMASQNADAPAASQAAVRANAKSSGETAASAGANRAPRQKMSYQEAMYALTGRRPKTAESQKDKSASGESASASAAAPSAVSQKSDTPAVSPHMASQNADAPAANQAAVRANAKSSGETAASAGANRAPRQKMSYQEAMYALTGRRPKTSESQKDKSASGESVSASAAATSAISQKLNASAAAPSAASEKLNAPAAVLSAASQKSDAPAAAPSASSQKLNDPAASKSVAQNAGRADISKLVSPDRTNSNLSSLSPSAKSKLRGFGISVGNENKPRTVSYEPQKDKIDSISSLIERNAKSNKAPKAEPASASTPSVASDNSLSTNNNPDVPKQNVGSTLAAASALLSQNQSDDSQVALTGLTGNNCEASVEMLAIKAADIRQAAQAANASGAETANLQKAVHQPASHQENASAKEIAGSITSASINFDEYPKMNPHGELKRDEEREELKKRSHEEFLNSIGISIRPKKIGGRLNSASARELPTTIVPESAAQETSEDHDNGSRADNASANNQRAYDDLRRSLGLSDVQPASPKPAPSPRPAAAAPQSAPAPRPAAAAPQSAPAPREVAAAPKPAPAPRPAAAVPQPAPAPRPAAAAPQPAPAPRPAAAAPQSAPVYKKPADTPAFLEITRRTPTQQNNADDSSEKKSDLPDKSVPSAPKAGLVPKSLAIKPNFSKQFEDRASRERYSPLMAKQMLPKPGISPLLSSKPMLDRAQAKPMLDRVPSKPVLDITDTCVSKPDNLPLEKPAQEKPALASPHQEMPKLELSALDRNGSLAKNPVPSSNSVSMPGSRGGLKIGSLFKDIDDPSSVHDASGEYDVSGEYAASGEYVSGEYEASGEYYEDGEYVSGEYEASGEYVSGEYESSGEYKESGEYYESCEYEAEDEHIVTDELEYELPPIDLLNDGNGLVCSKSEDKSEALLEVLKSFKVDATLQNIVRGPAVTRYELKPAKGVSVKKFTNLQDDIALALAAKSLRIEAPVPGRPVVGIEVPNDSTELVALKDILDSDSFCSGRGLRVGLGKDITGFARTTDLVKMPHLLVAGTTGSGKSVCINTIILSLLYKFTPKHLQLLMIDPKQVELSIYKGIPHLIGLAGEEAGQIITDPKKAEAALRQAVELMETRYTLLAKNNVRNIDEYNAKVDDYLPWVVIIIDELADLMMVAAKSIEVSIVRLAQKARAAGIHLVVATQRPSTDVITGLMKVNIPSRIAFAVSSQVDSRVILDMNGAEHLLGKGDMLFKSVDSFDAVRIQGAFVTNEEIERVVEFWRNQGTPDNKIEFDITEPEPEEPDKEAEEVSSGDEELVKQALELILKKQQASASMLQTGLRIGYARARRVIEILEERGYVGPAEGSKPRKIYYTGEES